MRIPRIISLLLACCAGTASADRPVAAPAGQLSPNMQHDFYSGHGHAMSRQSWQSAYGAFGAELNCRDTGSTGPRLMFYPIHVPEAHILQYVDVWGWDNSSNDLGLRVLRVCQQFATPGLPAVTALGSASTSGLPLRFFLPASVVNEAATPATCSYVLEARFAADGVACTNSSLGLLRVRAQVRNPDLIFRDGHFTYNPPTDPTGTDARPGEQQ